MRGTTCHQSDAGVLIYEARASLIMDGSSGGASRLGVGREVYYYYYYYYYYYLQYFYTVRFHCYKKGTEKSDLPTGRAYLQNLTNYS